MRLTLSFLLGAAVLVRADDPLGDIAAFGEPVLGEDPHPIDVAAPSDSEPAFEPPAAPDAGMEHATFEERQAEAEVLTPGRDEGADLLEAELADAAAAAAAAQEAARGDDAADAAEDVVPTAKEEADALQHSGSELLLDEDAPAGDVTAGTDADADPLAAFVGSELDGFDASHEDQADPLGAALDDVSAESTPHDSAADDLHMLSDELLNMDSASNEMADPLGASPGDARQAAVADDFATFQDDLEAVAPPSDADSPDAPDAPLADDLRMDGHVPDEDDADVVVHDHEPEAEAEPEPEPPADHPETPHAPVIEHAEEDDAQLVDAVHAGELDAEDETDEDEPHLHEMIIEDVEDNQDELLASESTYSEQPFLLQDGVNEAAAAPRNPLAGRTGGLERNADEPRPRKEQKQAMMHHALMMDHDLQARLMRFAHHISTKQSDDAANVAAGKAAADAMIGAF